MNTQEKANESLKLKKNAINLLSKAIAKIILKFRLSRTEILNSLDEQLVLEAKKQDPDASNVTIAIRTGINRRYIPAYLKGESPKASPDKLASILEDLRWTAHKYYNSTKITKVGHFRTFQSICEQRAAGMLTYQAILDELVKRGNIKDLGNKVEILKLRHTTFKDDISYTNITATQINRTVNTIIYNLDINLSDERRVQRTIYSSQINPIYFNKLHTDIKLKISEYNTDITNLLLSYEESVAIGTYPEYGVAFLEYQNEE
jgi:hypothetical protein